MTLYSYKGQYPTQLPHRIKLSDGRTRTDLSTFTAEEIVDAGYISVSDKPVVNTEFQTLSWDAVGVDWVITDKTQEQLDHERYRKIDEQWIVVRDERDKLLQESDIWILRDFEAGNIANPDVVTYRQALRDLPQNTVDPFNVVWPHYPPDEPEQTVDDANSANTIL